MSESESHSTLKCLGLSYLTITILGAAISTIVAGVYGLIGISDMSHNTVKNDCPRSNLWPYVLVNVIIIFGNILINSKSKNEDKESGLICGLLQGLGLFVWGCVEVFDIASDCESLQKTNIYLSALIIVCIYAILIINGILALIGFLFSLIYDQFCVQKETNLVKSGVNLTEDMGV